MKKKDSNTYRIGLEREFHRVTPRFKLSPYNHPLSLGSSYFHPYITTDFAESQIELITKTFPCTKQALDELQNLMLYTYQKLKKELIYNFSPPLSTFPLASRIARFENIEAAHHKRIYRKGLSNRYGTGLQLFTGLHFNFSFTKTYMSSLGVTPNTCYLHVARNFMRYGWIILYLFGASPQLPSLRKKMQNACSLRMSYHGYSIKHQDRLPVSLNNIDDYCKDLTTALQTPFSRFKNKNFTQLNDNILQTPAEYYCPIRLKVHNKQIQYLEIRCLDINPFFPCGVDIKTLNFIRDLLFFLATKESPPLSYRELNILKKNFQKVAMHGRDPKTTLTIDKKTKPLQEFCAQILQQMHYDPDIMDPLKLPSNRLQAYVHDEDIMQFLDNQQQDQKNFWNRPLDTKAQIYLDKIKKKSLDSLVAALSCTH